MAENLQKSPLADRDVNQAITALKKGAYLLKYGRRGKPKFCPFRISTDESTLIWYYGKDEKQLELRHVSKIIPGQRTAIFQRYPRPEKEYQSFSLVYNDRSLDLICKDKDEAEVWFIGLKALLARCSSRKARFEGRSDTSISSDSSRQRISPTAASFDQGDTLRTSESRHPSRLGKAFADIISYTAAAKNPVPLEPATVPLSAIAPWIAENSSSRISAADTVRVSCSSAVSSSSQGSCHEDFDALGDVFIWGEGTGDGILGGGGPGFGMLSSINPDAYLPKALESSMVLDVQSIACGSKHAVLVNKQGAAFSWGEESGGRLGHGVDAHVSQPKLIDALTCMNIEMVACGEYHTCAVTLSGDLYTWGDGNHNSGLLGHGSEVSHWIPKKVSGLVDGLHISYVSCGPWHTALITLTGQLFTFGDGTFGALGHGDHDSTSIPREVEALLGLRSLKVACGVWHTAAVVEIMNNISDSISTDISSSQKLFTWGDGDKGQLGHGDREPRLVPECVAGLVDASICQVACGHDFTVTLTTSGQVHTMGSNIYGQLGSFDADGKVPTLIERNIADSFIEEIACGSHHVAVLTSKSEVYTWGMGANGQLGHGDNDDRSSPSLVYLLKDKQVKSVVCGSNFTAVICLHKLVSSADNSTCSGCHNPFNFRRKRHNCYNCGLVFCNACSSRKSSKASLAPSINKPYRVCDDCYTKLQKSKNSGRSPGSRSGNTVNKSFDVESGVSRLQGQISRLSSADSFGQVQIRNIKSQAKAEPKDSRVFPIQKGNIRRESSVSSSKASKASPSSPFSGSRMVSQLASPFFGNASPLVSVKRMSLTGLTADLIVDDQKHNNDSLIHEVTYLRAQVEDLASKSQLLEAELERKSRKLKEVTALAADEAQKCRAAKEVIKSLTTQLKEMAERVSDRNTPASKSNSSAEQTSSDQSHPSQDSRQKGTASSKVELKDNSHSHPSHESSQKDPASSKVELKDNSHSHTSHESHQKGTASFKVDLKDNSNSHPSHESLQKCPSSSKVESTDNSHSHTSHESHQKSIASSEDFKDNSDSHPPYESHQKSPASSKVELNDNSRRHTSLERHQKSIIAFSEVEFKDNSHTHPSRESSQKSQASSKVELEDNSHGQPSYDIHQKSIASSNVKFDDNLHSHPSHENSQNSLATSKVELKENFDSPHSHESRQKGKAFSKDEFKDNSRSHPSHESRQKSVASSKVDLKDKSHGHPSQESSTIPAFSKVESKDNSASSSNGTRKQTKNKEKAEAEKVVQDEPGVYITLSPLPGGRNELKRVRFSRKHFTEGQAEKWWAENVAKVCEKHNIHQRE